MRALIIGGGIGGLTTAIALQKKGIDSLVFEQASEIKEAGAGLWIAPNGMQVMHRLGLTDELIKEGNPIIKMSVSDSKGKPITVLDNESDGVIKKFGFPHLAMHRASLQQILYRKLPKENVLTSKHFVRYEEQKNKVIAHFQDGSSYEGDFLIGTDGIKSQVRTQLLGEIPFRYSGATCWRGISEMTLPSAEINNVKEVWMDTPGLRSAYAQVNSHQVYFYITLCTPPNEHDEQGKTKEKLLHFTKGVASSIHEVINRSDDDHIMRNDLYDFAPINNWTKGKIVLLGDAAHATTPNLGQGANQAIESAYYIAEAITKNKTDLETAFQQYQKVRMKKAHYITNRSWQFGQLNNYRSAFARALRNGIIRYAPRSFTLKEFDRNIYSLNF